MSYQIMELASIEGEDNLDTKLTISGFAGPSKNGKNPRCIQMVINRPGDINPPIIQLDMDALNTLYLMIDDFAIGRDVENWIEQRAVNKVVEQGSIKDVPQRVKILKWDSYLTFGKYANNTIFITAFDCETGEPNAVCTVNWEANYTGNVAYSELCAFPRVVIKNYSENEGVLQSLITAGVIENKVIAYMKGTLVKAIICQLTEKWQKIAKLQLEDKSYGK